MTNQIMTNTTQIVEAGNAPANFVELVDKHAPAISTKVDAIFTTLANKAGVAVEYFWPLFVKQQLIEGISACMLYAVILLVIFSFFRIIKTKELENEHSEFNSWGVIAIIMGILGAIGIIGVFASFEYTVTNLFNPEYAAIKDLIEMVK